MKLPAFQFYPGDWRKDPGVQALSYHDRGVWHEMLCLMHESERRGVLVLNGHAMSDESLGRLLGLDIQNLTTTLTTLLTSGVASRELKTGALMNRRMVRDEKLREIRRNAGKQGGNPVLLKQKPTTRDKQKSTPSSSSSSSSSDFNTRAPGHADAPGLELTSESSAGPARKRDPLFDALAEAEGSKPIQLTTGAARSIGVALAEIRRACGDVTPAEIKRRMAIYHSLMPDVTHTANGLAKHWARCDDEPEHSNFNGKKASWAE